MDVKDPQSPNVHPQLYLKEGNNQVENGDVVKAEEKAEEDDEEIEEVVPNPPDNQESSSDSDGSASSSCQEKPEFIYVELANIRKDVQCPICLGIIKKTRTVMECLHRFCRECIDKSMRMGNNECPACRTHCASRRSLRDDPNYDALIAALYPDIEKYEEEELTFHEEERNRNKQIQAAIAQVFQRQEVSAKRRMLTAKDMGSRPHRSANSKRKRGSQEGEASDENCPRKGSTSTGELSAEGPGRRRATEAVNSHRRCSESYPKPSRTFYPEFECTASEMLVWGGGGARSQNRSRGCGSRVLRNTRLCRLLDHLRTRNGEDEELLHLLLVSEDEREACGLQKPFICCSPNVTVRHLCQYVASQMEMCWEDIELVGGPGGDEVPVFEAGQTLSVLRASLTLCQHNLKLSYRVKKKMEDGDC